MQIKLIILFSYFILSSIYSITYSQNQPNIIEDIDRKGNGITLQLDSVGDTVLFLTFKKGILNGPFQFSYTGTNRGSKFITSQIHNFSIDKEETFTVKGAHKNGVKNGICKTYYENGILFKEETYKNNVVVGVKKAYHDNGNIQFIEHLSKGKKNGLWQQFYNTGKLREERVYKENKLLTAVVMEWYDNGNKMNSTSYKYINDEKYIDGYVNRYYENGQIQLSSYYTKGKPDKKWIGYYPNGNIKYVIIYENSKFISHTNYNENGEMINE